MVFLYERISEPFLCDERTYKNVSIMQNCRYKPVCGAQVEKGAVGGGHEGAVVAVTDGRGKSVRLCMGKQKFLRRK